MNSDNAVRYFLEAWQAGDYEQMQDLSADDLNLPEFKAVDVTGFDIAYSTTAVTSGNHTFYATVDTPTDIHKLSITVIPKPGPFKAAHPYGVVSASVLEGLPKEDKLLSTDMTAKEAIQHINDMDEYFEGFVPEEEDRVTVLEALENK